jgi:hypothetical protein
MPTRGQPANLRAMQVKSPGIRWQKAPEALTYYALDLDHTSAKMRDILQAGIGITNLADLRVEFKKLKKQNFRNSEVKDQK